MSRANRYIFAAGVILFLAVPASSLYLARPKIYPTPALKLEADVRVFGTALEEYRHICGTFPTQEQGLAALVAKPTAAPVPTPWYQLMSRLPIDPWGKPYVYVIPARRSHQPYDVFSTGADRIESADDIGNWSGEK